MIINGKSLLKSDNIKRSGVIVYTILRGQMYFLLGIDRKSRDYTDFGGGCKFGETLVDAAWREFGEESCCIFMKPPTNKTPPGISVTLQKSQLLESVAVCDQNRESAIFFLFVDPVWFQHAESAFIECQKELFNLKKHIENIGVKWIHERDFQEIAFNRGRQCLWGRIQQFMIKNADYFELRVYLEMMREIEKPRTYPKVIENCSPRNSWGAYSNLGCVGSAPS